MSYGSKTFEEGTPKAKVTSSDAARHAAQLFFNQLFLSPRLEPMERLALSSLTKGQRALLPIDILNKVIRSCGGFKHFLGSQAGADVLVSEILIAFKLLGASSYTNLFQRVVARCGDLADLNRKVAEQSQAVHAAKKSRDNAAIESARKTWRDIFDRKRKREDEIDKTMEEFSEQFSNLLNSSDSKIETFIGAYVDRHPEEFFR